jgi:hypothetical protein
MVAFSSLICSKRIKRMQRRSGRKCWHCCYCSASQYVLSLSGARGGTAQSTRCDIAAALSPTTRLFRISQVHRAVKNGLLSDPLIGSLGDEPRKASDTIRLSTVSVIQKGCQSRFDFLSPSHMNETYVDIPILVSLVFFTPLTPR